MEERNLYSLAGCRVRHEENYTFLYNSDVKHFNMPPCRSPDLLIVEKMFSGHQQILVKEVYL